MGKFFPGGALGFGCRGMGRFDGAKKTLRPWMEHFFVRFAKIAKILNFPSCNFHTALV